MILLFGPTGVGKSTVLELVLRDLNRDVRQAADWNPGRLGPISVRAATGGQPFDWKDFNLRALQALGEVAIDKKVDPLGRRSQSRGTPDDPYGISIAASRAALEKALQHRRPPVFFVDEGQLAWLRVGPKRSVAQAEVFKSLALESGVLLGLAGTYDLWRFSGLNGQLLRRSWPVHFDRYHADNKKDWADWLLVVRYFRGKLPLTFDLEQQADALYERSIGCVGLLKSWLTRSYALALSSDKHGLVRLKHLEHTAIKLSAARKMAADAIAGEKTWDQTAGDEADLRKLLQLPPLNPSERANEDASQDDAHPKVSGGTHGRRAFERKPVRDPVGEPAGVA
ncbi:MAG TPA: AAA family ATPase [Chloroflexota bacterium]|nr:AAA family ATPase [Chloroflexota bacterium]